jgi:hypothetical protein
MSNGYIILTDSEGALYGNSFRFKALTVQAPLVRTDGLRTMLDGSPDKSAGAIIRRWMYMLRVPYTATPPYGTLANLKTLFLLNNPNGTPSDVITLTDHEGGTFTVYMMGELNPENLTTILDGTNSVYLVPLSLQGIANA